MARRNRSNDIQLTNENRKKVIEAERAMVVQMVAHFDRKGLHDTHWHKTLVRLDAALAKFEGDKNYG